jgi:choline monooxygenase
MAASFPDAAIRAASQGLNGDLATATALPGRFYGAEFFKLEQERLFPASWCAVTVASLVSEPGDVLPIDVAGWPVLVTRGRDGRIRAFHNMCRHRGIKLVTEPGNMARITCPWHAWTYALDGDLLAMPEVGGPKINQAEGFDKAALGLRPIAIGQWLDLVFVNIDGNAPPFAEWIKPLEDLFADYDFSGLRHAERLEDSYEANWKIAMEGGIEDYHLVCGHPQLNAHLFRNTAPCVHPPVYTGGYVNVRGEAPGHAGGERAWTARLPDLRTRDGEPLPRLYSLTLFPTGTVLVTADHVMLGTLLPDGPSRTRMDISLYYDRTSADDPAYADARQGNLRMWRDVIPQDKPFMEAAQATVSVRDRAGVEGRFSPYWEGSVRGFQQMVIQAVS